MNTSKALKQLNLQRRSGVTSKTQFEKECSLILQREGKQFANFKTRNLNTDHINYKIYYLLENPSTIIDAYSKISKNKGALTKGFEDGF